MAKHPTHSSEINDEPDCRDEAVHRAQQCLVQLARLLGRDAAQEFLTAYRADLEQTTDTETPNDG
jgi:hypothetical protein